jgi:hypothetical protein
LSSAKDSESEWARDMCENIYKRTVRPTVMW